MGFGGNYFTEGLGLFVRHSFMFTVTVVIGFLISAACIGAGVLTDSTVFPAGPWQFSFGLGASLGVGAGVFGVGVIAARIFLAPESTTVWTWAVLIAVEIATAMLVVTSVFYGHSLATAAAWTCGLFLSAIAGRGLWWFNAWMDRRWLAQLEMVREENSLRRLESAQPRWAKPPEPKGLPLDVPPIKPAAREGE